MIRSVCGTESGPGGLLSLCVSQLLCRNVGGIHSCIPVGLFTSPHLLTVNALTR